MPASKTREIYKGTPFRFPLRNEFAGRAGKIMRLAQDGRVVRVQPGWNERDLCNLRDFSDALRADGVRVPRYDVLRAPRWDRPKQATYIVTESIICERLDEIARPHERDWSLPVSRAFYDRLYAALDALVTSLIAHYVHLLQGGGLVFSAMDQSQFVYGTTRTDREPAIYFVDLDPTYSLAPPIIGLAQVDANAHKSDFEKPINILFELALLHPEAGLTGGKQAAREYFALCDGLFHDFYSRNTPWWSRAPNFEHYQLMKSRLLGM